jgi:hypothetical protein
VRKSKPKIIKEYIYILLKYIKYFWYMWGCGKTWKGLLENLGVDGRIILK